MRHGGVILSEADMHLGLGGRQEGVAGEGLPSVRRLVRNAITDHPTRLGSFINTRGSPSRSGAIISRSKRPPPHCPHPHLPFTPQSNMKNPIPTYIFPHISPSPADCQYGCAGTGYIQYTTEVIKHKCAPWKDEFKPTATRYIKKIRSIILFLSVNDRNRALSTVRKAEEPRLRQ